MLTSFCLEGVLVSIVIFGYLLIYGYQVRDGLSARIPISVHLFVLLFCVFAFWAGDFYGYPVALEKIQFNVAATDQSSHFETLYVWLYQIVQGNYLIWRLCVWCTAYLLFVKTLQNYKIYNQQAVALFIAYFLLMFSYARVSLAFALLFYGFSLIEVSRGKLFIRFLLGVLMIILSYFAHKSIIVAIALYPFVYVRINKYMLMLFVIGAVSFTFLGGDQMIADIFSSETTNDEYGAKIQNSANNYYNSELEKVGIGVIILRYYQAITLVLPILYCYMDERIYRAVKTNSNLSHLLSYALLIILVSLVFAIILGINSPMSYRIMFMAFVPNILLLSICFKQKLIKRNIYYRFFNLFAVYPVVRLLLCVYNRLVT